MTNYDDVRAFQIKFGLSRPDRPTLTTFEHLAERRSFMQEELDEFDRAAAAGDLAGVLDALVDVVYVAMGTAVQMGLPWQAAWDEVQRANMAKVRGESERSHVDVVKPPGWVGPDHDRVLREAGYGE